MSEVDQPVDIHITKPLDPVNPYAVIALIAGLLGLFPVAIVFGILAFWRPAGRGLAIAGLILGVLEALATAAFIYSASTSLEANIVSVGTASSEYATAQVNPTHIATPSTAAAARTTTVGEIPTVQDTETAAPIETAPEVDGSCVPAIDNHAIAADGTFLKCTYGGSTQARWVRSVPIIGTATRGDSCDPSVTGIAVSPEGQDLFCVSNAQTGSGMWSPGP